MGGDPGQQLAVVALVHHEPRRRLLPALRALVLGASEREFQPSFQPEPVELLASALTPAAQRPRGCADVPCRRLDSLAGGDALGQPVDELDYVELLAA